MKIRNWSRTLWIVIALGGILSPLLSQAHPLEYWHWRNPSVVGAPLSQVTYGAGLFVAVGKWGGIYTSADGIFWNDQASGTEEDLLTVAYGNGRFVAHGLQGTVLISEDGTRWTKMPGKLPAWSWLSAAAYGNGTFVVVGKTGRVYVSSDGIEWNEDYPGTSKDLVDVVYADGMFVAVGAEGTILTSSNGTVWTKRVSGTTRGLSGITRGKDLFVSVGRQGTVLVSSDGMTWSASDSGLTADLQTVSYGEGKFAVGGHDPLSGAYSILVSADGVNWTEKNSGWEHFSKMSYGNGMFVGVGFPVVTSYDGELWYAMGRGPQITFNGGTYGRDQFIVAGDQDTILSSGDGAVWTVRHSSDIYDGRKIFSVAYGNETYVALGKDDQIFSSPDGRIWVESKRDVCQGGGHLYYVNNLFIMPGNGQNICTSEDGASWTRRSSGPSGRLRSVAYGNGLYVAVGEDETIVTSEDGLTWTERRSGGYGSLFAVTYGDAGFVAAGEYGLLLTSPDGMNWVRRTYQPTEGFPSLYGLYGIAYGNGTYVAVGEYGLIVTSSDGVSWKVQSGTYSYGSGMGSVMFVNGVFIAAGGGPGAVMTSPNGVTWTRGNTGTEEYIYYIAYGNGKLVATASSGMVLTSSDGTVWKIEDERVPETLNNLVFGNGIFIGFAAWGNTYTSLDGANWTFRDSGKSDTIRDAIYRDGVFVGVGENVWGAASFVSADGLAWNANVIGADVWIGSVAYGNGLFVAAGSGIVTSSDGATWKVREVQGGSGIVYGNGIFVLIGGGIIRISSDGLTWTETYRDEYLTFSGIAYEKGTFAAVGSRLSSSSIVLYSSDGINWKRGSLRTNAGPLGITYGNDSFVIWGEDGMIMQSDPLTFCSISIDPNSYDFGSGYLGETSPLKEFVISNDGYSDLAIEMIALTGPGASDFIVRDDTCSGRTIPPLGHCRVEASFRPISTGPRMAFLVIPSNDPRTPEASLELTGLGLGPDIQVFPEVVDFINVPPGDSDHQTVTVRNQGDVDLILYDIGAPESPFALDGGTCKIAGVVRPGDQCALNIRFSPAASGRYRSVLAITSNDPDQARVLVDLRAISGPEFSISWEILEWVCKETTKKVKCKIQGVFTVRNSGTVGPASAVMKFYLSDDQLYDPADRFLKEMNTGSLRVEQVKRKKFSYNLAPGEKPTDKYLVVVIE